MRENKTNEKQLNNLVKRTLSSGVKPLEAILEPVYDCFYGETEAYRVCLWVNSVISGALKPEDYLRAQADGKILADVSVRALKKAIGLKKRLIEDGDNKIALYVRCSVALLTEPDLYYRLKSLLKAENYDGAGIYLEFYPEAFETETEILKSAFCDVRAAGLKIAIDGYGGEGFPLEKLLSVCPDTVFADEKLAEMATDREKNAAVAPLVNLVKSLGGRVIATGVRSDEQLREFRARDCLGFVPSDKYSGALGVLCKTIKADELEREGD